LKVITAIIFIRITDIRGSYAKTRCYFLTQYVKLKQKDL